MLYVIEVRDHLDNGNWRPVKFQRPMTKEQADATVARAKEIGFDARAVPLEVR